MNRKRTTLLSVATLIGAMAGFLVAAPSEASAICYTQNWVATSCWACQTPTGGGSCFNYYGTCMPTETRCGGVRPPIFP
jgi:hypothetical protein